MMTYALVAAVIVVVATAAVVACRSALGNSAPPVVSQSNSVRI